MKNSIKSVRKFDDKYNKFNTIKANLFEIVKNGTKYSEKKYKLEVIATNYDICKRIATITSDDIELIDEEYLAIIPSNFRIHPDRSFYMNSVFINHDNVEERKEIDAHTEAKRTNTILVSNEKVQTNLPRSGYEPFLV